MDLTGVPNNINHGVSTANFVDPRAQATISAHTPAPKPFHHDQKPF